MQGLRAIIFALLAIAGVQSAPAAAQDRKVEGLADGTYYVFGRKLVISTPTPGTMLLRRTDDPTQTTDVTVAPNGSAKMVMKGLIMSATIAVGFAGSRGIFIDGWFLGRGADGAFYNVLFTTTSKNVKKIARFSRLVPAGEPNAVQVSRDTDIRDVAAIQQLLGCPLDNLGPCVTGDAPVEIAVTSKTAPETIAAPEAVVDLSSAIKGPRLALVMGNAGYTGSMGRLANPVNDTRIVAAALGRDGFDVTVVADADQKAMKRALIAFGAKVSQAGPNAAALFYYAGHGVQTRGVNYLVPVGAMIDSESDVEIEAVAADAVVSQLEQPNVAISIVILDACRNLPLQRQTRSAAAGLARMEAPSGAFIAYSTAPGQVALDGAGGTSPFAAALIAELAKPAQPIEAMFRNVRRSVVTATNGQQTPWDNSSLVNTFVFSSK